ncbi:MAG: hypothetical protein GY702_15405 [Desulfobulbaceae bacterium]|nr:hypothetical protein [Desulfobulbaceae bacterium]
MQTVVKKWFRNKNCGVLDNRGGPEIQVRKEDLVGCSFLKVGVIVEFECHPGKQGLIAKKVSIFKQKKPNNRNKDNKEFRFGVMT